jgi:hypothetical protein
MSSKALSILRVIADTLVKNCEDLSNRGDVVRLLGLKVVYKSEVALKVGWNRFLQVPYPLSELFGDVAPLNLPHEVLTVCKLTSNERNAQDTNLTLSQYLLERRHHVVRLLRHCAKHNEPFIVSQFLA